MVKSKILPMDDLNEAKEMGEKKQAEVEKAKVKAKKQKKETEETTTVTREKITPPIEAEEKTEEKKDGKEFPEFELAFDPFADQSSK